MARGEAIVGSGAIKELAFFFIARFIKFLFPKTGLNATPLFFCVHGLLFSIDDQPPFNKMHRLSMPVIFYSSGKNESRLLGLRYNCRGVCTPSPSSLQFNLLKNGQVVVWIVGD